MSFNHDYIKVYNFVANLPEYVPTRRWYFNITRKHNYTSEYQADYHKLDQIKQDAMDTAEWEDHYLEK